MVSSQTTPRAIMEMDNNKSDQRVIKTTAVKFGQIHPYQSHACSGFHRK